MMFVKNWGDVFTQSLQGVWYGVASVLPSIVLAVVIFAIGWLLAVLVEKIVEGLFKGLKIDAALKGAGLEDVMKRAGHSLNSGHFVGTLVKWFIIVVFLMASFDVLGLTQVNEFLRNVVLSYLPQVIIAVLVLMVAVVIADAMQKVVLASAKAAHVKSAHLLGVITRWSIWIFAILTALFQLGIAPSLIQTIVMGIVAGGALAIGLAFGLGGKEVAADIIEKTRHTLSDKE
jgi:small-conductance mechanosensitive channel